MAEAFWKPYQCGMPILSLRQREVLHLIVQDKSNKEIANALAIEVKTVEKYRAELKRRLGARGTAGLVSSALRKGLILFPQDKMQLSTESCKSLQENEARRTAPFRYRLASNE
jgi:DNA-binding CsgD family transcriptional regulator